MDDMLEVSLAGKMDFVQKTPNNAFWGDKSLPLLTLGGDEAELLTTAQLLEYP